MKISSIQIKNLIEKLFASNQEFNLENDYYWEISSEDLFQMYVQPKELMAGQLSDDWEELQNLLENEREPIFTHDLTHLCQILKAISVTEGNTVLSQGDPVE